MGEDYVGDYVREYDRRLDVLLRTFGADDTQLREQLMAPLGLQRGARVLETGCGTCRDATGRRPRGSPGAARPQADRRSGDADRRSGGRTAAGRRDAAGSAAGNAARCRYFG